GLRRHHHRDRRRAAVLLRRGLPPAVPGQEPVGLLRHRRHRCELPDRPDLNRPQSAAMEWSVANTLRKQLEDGRGDTTAMIYADRSITWSQMHERSARVAHALLAEGVTAGDRVAFIDKNGPEYFEVLFGGGMLNAVNVNVNWRLAPPEVEYIVND